MRRGVVVVAACLSAGGIACSGSSSPDKICSTSSPLKTCPGNAVVKGVDVSTYQSTIAWSQAKAAGIQFAFARISDGSNHIDSQFAANWGGMKSASVVRGSYQFFRAGQDALAQVNVITSSLAAVGGLQPGDLPVVMDIETSDGQTVATLQSRMATWLDALTKATGRPPIIYTNASTASLFGTGFAKYPLWVANWNATCPTMPAGWTVWRFWQYTDMGTVSGITGLVDLDEFDGTLADLFSFGGASVDAGRADAHGAGITDGGDAADQANIADASVDAAIETGPGRTKIPLDDAGAAQPAVASDAGLSEAGAVMHGGATGDASVAVPICRP